MAWKLNCTLGNVMSDIEGNMIITLAVVGRDKNLTKRAIEEIKALKENKLTATLTEYKKNRSVEQNRLMWGLIEKIVIADTGKRLEEDMQNTYIQMLTLANAKFEYYMCMPKAEPLLRESARAIKFVEKRIYNNVEMHMYKVWYGSSKFNTKEMFDFTEMLFDELAKRGIYDQETQYWREEFDKNKKAAEAAEVRKSKKKAEVKND